MLSKEIKSYMASLGKMSGKDMTKEERTERARKAVKARWEKHKNVTVDNSHTK